jgi:dihydrofolate reductase
MRSVVLAMFMSLDGYIEDANGQIAMPPFSPDLKSKWIDRNTERADLMMYGRTAYEGIARFWTSPVADRDEAAILERATKIVFSTTLAQAEWGNVRIVRADIPAEIARLKGEPGKDMLLFGGASIANSFLRLGLVDELSLLVSPFLLGGGKRLFQGGQERTNLKLKGTEPFDSGVVLMTYRWA